MIGYDDPVVAACGIAFNSWFTMLAHQKDCGRCKEVMLRDFDTSPLEENDADDRGICYEED